MPSRRPLFLIVSLALLTSTGCATQHTTVRVSTATTAEIEDARNKDEVWFEFRKGDRVPFSLAFFGVLEGLSADDLVIRARKLFYLVVQKNMPIRMSFDGQTIAQSRSSQSIIAILPKDERDESAEGGRVAWFHYLGEEGQPEQEFEKFTKRLSKKQQVADQY